MVAGASTIRAGGVSVCLWRIMVIPPYLGDEHLSRSPACHGMFDCLDVRLFVVLIGGGSIGGDDLLNRGAGTATGYRAIHIAILHESVPGIDPCVPGGKPGIAITALGVGNAAQIANREADACLACGAKTGLMHEKCQ